MFISTQVSLETYQSHNNHWIALQSWPKATLSTQQADGERMRIKFIQSQNWWVWHTYQGKHQQLERIILLTVNSLGTFIFQTPPLALLSSSLRTEQAVSVTPTSLKTVTGDQRAWIRKRTTMVFFRLSSDDNYISVAGWKRWVYCCTLSKSSTQEPKLNRNLLLYWTVILDRKSIITLNLSSRIRSCYRTVAPIQSRCF